MTNPNKKPIPFCSFGGYRSFCSPWWADLSWWLTGFHWNTAYHGLNETYGLKAWYPIFSWGRPGWLSDVLTYWRRARYGWAPKDTWNLDHYLDNVLAGSLWHLAATKNGTPACYPNDEAWDDSLNWTQAQWDAVHTTWENDLKRWSTAFREAADGSNIYDAEDGYKRHNAEEQRIQENLNAALKDLIKWWRALWD